MRVKDRVAVVTGAGRGIGEACALRLAEEGAKVAVSDIDGESAKKVAEAIRAQGGSAIAKKLDVRERGEVKALMEETASAFGRLDILVNNAGYSRPALLPKLTEDMWDLVINVSLKGQFNCAQFATPYMMQQNYGKIINISSLAYMGNVGNANYSSAKAGIIGLTKALAKELGKYNIHVNCIAPGPIDTPGLRERLPEKYIDLAVKNSPLKRIGKPIDVANAVLFLASDESTYITGNVLHVSGGLFD